MLKITILTLLKLKLLFEFILTYDRVISILQHLKLLCNTDNVNILNNFSDDPPPCKNSVYVTALHNRCIPFFP